MKLDLSALSELEMRDAVALAEHPVLASILDALRRKYASEWLDSTTDQADQRERLHLKVQVLEDLRTELTSIADDQKLKAFNNKKSRSNAIT